jgi:hypothetical protein
MSETILEKLKQYDPMIALAWENLLEDVSGLYDEIEDDSELTQQAVVRIEKDISFLTTKLFQLEDRFNEIDDVVRCQQHHRKGVLIQSVRGHLGSVLQRLDIKDGSHRTKHSEIENE